MSNALIWICERKVYTDMGGSGGGGGGALKYVRRNMFSYGVLVYTFG